MISHHQHHNKQMASFAFFVRMAIGGLLLVGCLVITFSTPSKAPYHGKAAKKRNSLTKHRASSLERRDEVTATTTSSSTSSSAVSVEEVEKFANIDLSLPTFPTLQKELDRSEVVVLYFAAKWCKMSTPITSLIDTHIMSTLRDTAKLPANTKRPFSLIYVSSDMSKSQYKNYNQLRSWTKVPFQSPERKLLKRYFKVCAKREMEKLQIHREHELPFMVVLSGKTHKVVSKRGVEELKEHKENVTRHWLTLVRGNKDGGASSTSRGADASS